ncbi:MAG: hypothetical protein II776_03580 [Clostridia bacterium]|nr:hypothetical protein [Clostridia bacterium]
MELDQELLQKIERMNDRDLTEAVSRVAQGLGLDEALLRPYLARTDLLRTALARLTPEDLDKAAKVLGEDRARDVMDRIREEAERV